MDDVISRQAALDCVTYDVEYTTERIKALPSLQPTCNQLATDCISRQAAIDALCKVGCGSGHCGISCDDVKAIEQLPSAQPFHNITMNDVLKYIDGMPEDVWQEFTACLECRGWELQRRTAKWCGGEFA